MMWDNMITLGGFSISVDDETDKLCKSIKENAKKLAKLRETSRSQIMRPLLLEKLKEIEKELE